MRVLLGSEAQPELQGAVALSGPKLGSLLYNVDHCSDHILVYSSAGTIGEVIDPKRRLQNACRPFSV